MKFKIISLFIVFLCLNISAYAKTYFVNGVSGNDTFDGQTLKTALKTIQKAVDIARGGDEVIVEGKNLGLLIEYKECVRLDESKFGVSVKGMNEPILNGDFELQVLSATNDTIANTGIGFYVEAVQTTISGFKIKNFIFDEKQGIGKISGAAIYTLSGTMKHSILNNIIENCNWGIYLDGPSFCSVEGNSINKMETYEFEGQYIGGAGIVLHPSGFGLENNSIGSNSGNKIKNADTYGIVIGNKGETVLADNSAIGNNMIENCGIAGIAVLDIEGILKVEKNVFLENECAVLIGGMPIDAWIGDNFFKGSKGESEIATGPDYDGYLLFNIWQKNNNTFDKPTFAAMNKDAQKEELIITEKGGFIRTNMSEAEDDSEGKHRIVEKK